MWPGTWGGGGGKRTTNITSASCSLTSDKEQEGTCVLAQLGHIGENNRANLQSSKSVNRFPHK